MDPLLKKIFIASFCVFHMVAVGLYAMPGPLRDLPVIREVRPRVQRLTRPYVLLASQWQSWPLFAPDPLRRVTNIVIERHTPEGEWKRVAVHDQQNFRWWRHAKELKVVERLYRKNHREARKRYLFLQCLQHQLPAGTKVRIRHRYYVLPKNTVQKPVSWWRKWQPNWRENIDVGIICPPPPPWNA